MDADVFVQVSVGRGGHDTPPSSWTVRVGVTVLVPALTSEPERPAAGVWVVSVAVSCACSDRFQIPLVYQCVVF